MSKLVFAVWRANAETMQNESVASRIDTLNSRVRDVIAATTPSFIVFVAAEFIFSHANRNAETLRWYTPKERKAALKALAAASRAFNRLLLVGGTICWAEEVSHSRAKSEWLVRNETPVFYAGQPLTNYGKRFYGGEVYAEDHLRLYKKRRGDFSLDMFVAADTGDTGERRYDLAQATGNMSTLASEALRTIRGNGNERLPAAPGIKAAVERYKDRVRFEPGASEASFDIPGGNFTGGVEICQEHNGPGQSGRGTLQANSGRGPTNFHILTSNSVSHRPGHENLRSPGYFVHCDTACEPVLVELQGTRKTTTQGDRWRQLSHDLQVLEVDMPGGL
jgi:hypothetical protein